MVFLEKRYVLLVTDYIKMYNEYIDLKLVNKLVAIVLIVYPPRRIY